ncbi:MAG: hypothetical protein ACFE75_01525 [Candidatus Hodarchaeota archaeon]
MDNTFGETREINSFTKNEIFEIKNSLMKFKSEKTEESEIYNYLKSKLQVSSEVFDLYSSYLKDLKEFIEIHLLPFEDSHYFYLKNEILDELNLISNNLKNLGSNTRNIKRFIKNKTQLDEFLARIDRLLELSDNLTSEINHSLKEIEKIYNDDIYLWSEINRIKNLNFKLNEIPITLENWNEIKDLFIFIKSLSDLFSRKRKREKENLLTFRFDEVYQYFLSKDEGKIRYYLDLLHLLHNNKIFELYTGEEFINILERKEVIQNLKKFIRPLVKQLIEEKLHDILFEIEDFNLKEKDLSINIKTLKDQKLNIFLPKIVNYYIVGLEKKFQEKIHDVIEAEKFEEIANFYYQKIDVFWSKVNEIEDWVLNVENFLNPYENITVTLRKIFSNVSSEIYRRKNEYLTFIKTIKDEELRVEIRKFVSDKISEMNDLIRIYEDEASIIIKEEFPQLKKIKEILNEYYIKIKSIKDAVFKKLDSVKSNDIDIYQVIKFWEDSINRKKQQLTFLISLLLNKLFKTFKDLIDKEGILFATITEITEQTENFEGLPLNFALSSFLAEKLTENELKERISEIKAKINQLNNSLGLYQVEVSKLEKILANRVKLRKGISDSDVQCTVCHTYINFAKDKVITCPFCASTYHYLCVAFWLSKYNSCPMCQNHFLEPHSEMFESGEDQELERF